MTVDADVAIEALDLHATMHMQLLGRFDPTGSRTSDTFEKVHVGRSGGVLRWCLTRTERGLHVSVTGDGAAAELDAFVSQFPLCDGRDAFAPAHPVLRRLHRAFNGLRLLRVPWLFDVAAGAVLQQRVRWRVGYADFRRIAQAWGTSTPNGAAFPDAARLAAVPMYQLEARGIDAKRARALAGLARLEATRGVLHGHAGGEAIRRRLESVPGIGPWTSNLIAGYGLGDPDAVPVGDLHLPSLVTSSLAGEPEGTDTRMLELLEPYRGHRFRAVRLLEWAAGRAPRLLQPRRAVADMA